MRTLIVGDVHGCADELRALLAQAKADRVVMVGDLFTKGPDPAGVYELVRGREAVMGNHDDRLIRVLDQDRTGDTHANEVIQILSRRPGCLAWLRSLPSRIELEHHTVVHAGLDPHKPARTTRKQAMLIRRDPSDERSFWWQSYRGKRGVVFGHDARRGLVRVEKKGRPHLLGLDTGCVYGGSLTGWLVEEDRYLQVKAAHIYEAIPEPTVREPVVETPTEEPQPYVTLSPSESQK